MARTLRVILYFEHCEAAAQRVVLVERIAGAAAERGVRRAEARPVVRPGGPVGRQLSERGDSCLPPASALSTRRIAGRSPRAIRPTGGPPAPRTCTSCWWWWAARAV